MADLGDALHTLLLSDQVGTKDLLGALLPAVVVLNYLADLATQLGQPMSAMRFNKSTAAG